MLQLYLAGLLLAGIAHLSMAMLYITGPDIPSRERSDVCIELIPK